MTPVKVAHFLGLLFNYSHPEVDILDRVDKEKISVLSEIILYLLRDGSARIKVHSI